MLLTPKGCKQSQPQQNFNWNVKTDVRTTASYQLYQHCHHNTGTYNQQPGCQGLTRLEHSTTKPELHV